MLLEVAMFLLSPGRAWHTADMQEHEADKFALDLTRRQSLGRHVVREVDGSEPEQSAARADLQVLPLEPPEHRRTNRLLQQLSPATFKRVYAGRRSVAFSIELTSFIP